MTRDEQTTDRALDHAETTWLEARGWTRVQRAFPGTAARFTHPELVRDGLESLSQRDALVLTRAERLRFRSR